MVSGMAKAFLGSFLVVLLMMLLLLRSGIWALLAMVPLTVSIGAIYGIIGLIGKDFDMPVAVLSALSLGLAVDFAIHFLVQARARMEERGSWEETVGSVFGPPARAITRNGLVVTLGFLPLLAAPLVPYQTVGALIAAILIASGGATLVILPALIRFLEPWLFPRTQNDYIISRWVTFALASMVIIGVFTMGLHLFAEMNIEKFLWGGMLLWSLAVLVFYPFGGSSLVASFFSGGPQNED